MRVIKNLLAIIGLITILGGIAVFYKAQAFMSTLDPKAPQVYTKFMEDFAQSKDPADAMMWAFPVDEGLSPQDVVESLKSLAVQHRFLFVGESPFYKQAEAVTGKPYRYTNFLSFCDVRVGMKMADYNPKYTAFMPCRIAVVQDAQGKLWLYSMNLDFMIYGGKPLPPELKDGAIKVSDTIQAIMKGASHGEF